MKRYFVLVIAFLLTLSACSSSTGDIEVHSPWVRPTAKGENAAVYLTLHNHSATADELIGASSNVADMVEIHESMMENDVMQMHMIDSVPLAADQEVIFEPGGLHIMLIGVKQDLVLGEHIGVVLHFKNHDDIVVEVHIEDMMPGDDHMHMEGNTPQP
ncbi:MAG: copper chaperone PCu(A)C [Anaerolineales bacterium]